MKLDVSAKAPAETPGDVLVLERYAGEERLSPEVRRIDLALGGLLSLALQDQRFEGRIGEIADLHTGGRFPAKRVLVVGLGPRADCTAEVVRRAAAAAARRGRDLGAASLLVPVLGTRAPGLGIAQRAQVRYLLFTHIIPPVPVRALEGPFLGRSRDIFHGTVRVGHDGDFLSLPAGSTEIRRTDRLATFR